MKSNEVKSAVGSGKIRDFVFGLVKSRVSGMEICQSRVSRLGV